MLKAKGQLKNTHKKQGICLKMIKFNTISEEDLDRLDAEKDKKRFTISDHCFMSQVS